MLAELKADEDDVFSRAFADCKTAADVAKALSEFPNTDGGESGSLDYFARIVEKHLSSAYESKTGTGDVEIDVVGSGYYLVKDIKDSVEAGGAYTRALLEVVGDSDMVVKSEVPSGKSFRACPVICYSKIFLFYILLTSRIPRFFFLDLSEPKAKKFGSS